MSGGRSVEQLPSGRWRATAGAAEATFDSEPSARTWAALVTTVPEPPDVLARLLRGRPMAASPPVEEVDRPEADVIVLDADHLLAVFRDALAG